MQRKIAALESTRADEAVRAEAAAAAAAAAAAEAAAAAAEAHTATTRGDRRAHAAELRRSWRPIQRTEPSAPASTPASAVGAAQTEADADAALDARLAAVLGGGGMPVPPVRASLEARIDDAPAAPPRPMEEQSAWTQQAMARLAQHKEMQRQLAEQNDRRHAGRW